MHAQARGVGGNAPPGKLKIRCSEMASKAIFELNKIINLSCPMNAAERSHLAD